MKIAQLFFLGGFLAISLSFIACGKDDPKTCDWLTESQSEYDALVAAATTYGNDPTTANCNAYKQAYQAYLNEIKDRRDCAVEAGQGPAIDDAISQAQAQLDALQC